MPWFNHGKVISVAVLGMTRCDGSLRGFRNKTVAAQHKTMTITSPILARET
jgi:hypothetical protein